LKTKPNDSARITRAGTKYLDQTRIVPIFEARAEEPGEGFADGRQGVQPVENRPAVGTVGETGVEQSANLRVQPGDFTDARHNEVAFPFHAGL
jgi:hypothetical protein